MSFEDLLEQVDIVLGSGKSKNKNTSRTVLYNANIQPSMSPEYQGHQFNSAEDDVQVQRRKGYGQRQQGRRYRRPYCYLCEENHAPWFCTKFETGQEVRKRLEQIGRCRGCTVINKYHEESCVKREIMKCKHHPTEPHFGWTCDGKEHPGWQGKADR